MKKNEINYGINDESRADVFVRCQVLWKGPFSLCVFEWSQDCVLTYYAITTAHIHRAELSIERTTNHTIEERINTMWITVNVKKMAVTCLSMVEFCTQWYTALSMLEQQYQKLFTQLLKRFNLLTYSNVNEFHTLLDSIVLAWLGLACVLLPMHAIDTYPIFHPSSIITIHQHIIIVVSYLSANLSYKSQPITLVCIHTHYASMSMSTIAVIIIIFNMLLTCKLIDIFYTYLLIPIFLIHHIEVCLTISVSCLGWLFYQRSLFNPDTQWHKHPLYLKTWNGAPRILVKWVIKISTLNGRSSDDAIHWICREGEKEERN